MNNTKPSICGARRIPLASVSALAGCLLAGQLSAIQYTDTIPFTLSPGESGLGLKVHQFSVSGYTLNSVTIQLTATFRADLTLFGLAGSDVTYSWQLGSPSPASPTAVLSPVTVGLLIPAPVSCPLSGSCFVPADDSVTFEASQGGSSSAAATDSTTLDIYRGSGTVEYAVDIAAVYPELVSTTPASANAIFANALMTGALVVTYDATPPPTSVPPVRDFAANWAGGGRVLVQWWSQSNSGFLGLVLERRINGGEWARVGDGLYLIPTNGGPVFMSHLDETVPTDGQVNYRLTGVKSDGTLDGATEVAAGPGISISIQPTALGSLLRATGRPHTQLSVECASTPIHPIWTRVGTLTLGETGEGTIGLVAFSDERMKFYRLSEP